MTELQLNDFGRFHFSYKKKGIVVGLDLVATVIEADKSKYVMLEDNDEYSFLVKKTDIKSFEPMKQPEKP